MLSVKECCCGCSLRTGSLILLWIGLIIESICFLMNFFGLLIVEKIATPTYTNVQSSMKYHEGVNVAAEVAEDLTIIMLCLLILSGIGVAFCLCAIIGINKNIPKYVTFGVYYYGYQVAYCILLIFMWICVPGMASKFIPGASKDLASAMVPAYVVAYLFGLALTSYFFIVVKSFRNEMIKSISGRGINYAA